ncbi:MAG: lactoylglutathione lyase, partial [Desulfobacteraceae bacterium]
MNFTFAHNNFNVLNLEKSLDFYKKALQLTEVRRKEAPDGSFILAFLGDGRTQHQLELTWLKDRREPYNLGDNEFHLALVADDFVGAHALHEKMGCI